MEKEGEFDGVVESSDSKSLEQWLIHLESGWNLATISEEKETGRFLQVGKERVVGESSSINMLVGREREVGESSLEDCLETFVPNYRDMVSKKPLEI